MPRHLQMTNYLVRGALPSLVPLIAELHGWTDGQIAWMMALFSGGYLSMQLPAGASGPGGTALPMRRHCRPFATAAAPPLHRHISSSADAAAARRRRDGV